MPGLIGLIISGMILGPHASGILERDQSIVLFGKVGILYIMFTAGLEIDLVEFSKSRIKIITFGILTFLIPQTLGIIIGIYILKLSFLASALFGSLLASHTLLAYPVVSKYGITKKEAVTITIGGTIIADVGALLVMAVTAQSSGNHMGLFFWLKLITSLSVFVIGIFYFAPILIRWFFRNIQSDGVTEYIFVLFIVFFSAFSSELAGVEPIIGAFFAGLTLNRFIPRTGPLMNRIHFIGDALFIPFFLISIGMLVDLSVLFSGFHFWVISISMISAVSLGKFLPAILVQKLFKYKIDEGFLIFGLSVPHAAASLAGVLVGYRLKLLSEDVLNATVLMVLFTSMLGSFLTEIFGKRIAFRDTMEFEPNQSLRQRIIVPISNPETMEALIDLAILIRDPLHKEPIYPLSVVRELEAVESHVSLAEKRLSASKIRGSASGVPVEIITRIDENIVNGIFRATQELNITEMVIGWNGRPSAKDKILGGIFDRLITVYTRMILLTKIVRPLNSIKRLVIYIPPDSYHESGFIEIVSRLKFLSGQVGAEILIYSTEFCLLHLKGNIEKIKPAAKVSFKPVLSWFEFFQIKNWTVYDMMVLIGARRGTLSYSSELEKISKLFSKKFTDNNFIIAYPEQKYIRGQNVY